MAIATSNPSRFVDRKPDRITLIANPGTENAEAYPVLLNPTRLTNTIQVDWAKLPVVGLDHEVVHYSRTRSITVPMSFYFSIFEKARQANIPNADPEEQIRSAISNGSVPASKLLAESIDFMNFISSLCFPTRTGLRPPTVKVIWPNILSFLAVVDNVHFEFFKFDRTLAPITYQADVNFLEVRLTRRYAEEVRFSGLVADGEAFEG